MGMTGAILAGGASRRMGGEPKAWLPVAGRPMIERIAERMRAVCDGVVVAAASPGQAAALSLGRLGLALAYDAVPNGGPLAGLHAALGGAAGGIVWISACDMPFADERIACWLAERLRAAGAAAAVPRVGGRLHPLQAVYRSDCRPSAEAALNEGALRLTDWLARLDVLEVGEEEIRRAGFGVRFVVNVNTPEQYREWSLLMPGEGGAKP